MDYNELLDLANNGVGQDNDDAMYERPQPPQEQYVFKNEEIPAYSAEEEMRRIQERQEKGVIPPNLERSKIPRSIINEFMENPINYTVEDPQMRDFEQRMGGKMNSAADLMQRLDNMSVKKGVVEYKDIPKQNLESVEEMFAPIQTDTPHTNSRPSYGGGSDIDYKLIKTIIEQVIDERLESLAKVVLTESKKLSGGNNGIANIKAIKLGEKFMILDENNNVYSCTPQYVGKNKAQKKK